MAQRKQIEIVSSFEILREVNRVFDYDKIRKILERSGTKVANVMATIVRLSSIVDVKIKVQAIEEDPSDNDILACAGEVGANFVISGDRHLLRLEKHGKTKIITASEFTETVSSRGKV